MIKQMRFVSTTDSKLSQLQIGDSQLIFVNDTRKICLDVNGVRTEYNQIIILGTDSDRVNYLTPLKAFYFVDETKVFWQYDGEKWIPLTTTPHEQIVFLNYSNLPKIGVDNILYITENHSYRWNGEGYTQLGLQTWEEI